MEMEAYLKNSTELYKNGKFGVNFEFEGGYDPYTFHQYKLVEATRTGHRDGKEVMNYMHYHISKLTTKLLNS